MAAQLSLAPPTPERAANYCSCMGKTGSSTDDEIRRIVFSRDFSTVVRFGHGVT
jgi:hypothetical protein